MIKRNLLIIFWIAVIALLLMFSMVFTDSNKAIVAQVEPMKKAISYRKAVRVLEIFVMPGQKVAPGDLLVKVERPDLILDLERKNNDLERLVIEKEIVQAKFEQKQKSLKINKEQKLRKIQAEIDQLELIVQNNKKLSNQFGSLTGFSDTIQNYGNSYYQIELDALKKDFDFTNEEYLRETEAAQSIYLREMKSIQIRENEISEEIRALEEEENQLIKRAELNGTVGSISAQTGELLSPYSNILSVYELNPSVIKAVMNEGIHYDAHLGQVVMVESTNRKYQIEGKIIEIGSRIIEYPNRLKSNENISMYGRELFIRIPKENEFLNGERVFVSIRE
jgi:multidrug resistance efflux pump